LFAVLFAPAAGTPIGTEWPREDAAMPVNAWNLITLPCVLLALFLLA
jgi:hypothetical protein